MARQTSLILDTENTTYQKGNPFSRKNKCCAIGYKDGTTTTVIRKIEYDDEPYGDALREVQAQLDNCDVLVGFNLKYDLHWLRRYGITFRECRLWDVQIAHFYMMGQVNPYPALDDVAEYYGFPKKLDVVKTEYWEKGLDTTEVPWDILYDYLKQDVHLTQQCYEAQLKALESDPAMRQLIKIACMDTLVLEEMEWNGILYDTAESLRLAKINEGRLEVIDLELTALVGVSDINWNSGQQISAILYGGLVPYTVREPVERTLKSGAVTTRLRNVVKFHKFPRLVEPLDGTKLKRENCWQTGAPVLERIKCKGKAKIIIERLVERADLEKLNSTYYFGLPKLIGEMDWEPGTIHGNLNQCVAVTGRLSSTKPNMQNNPPAVDLLFRSRYAD